MEEAGARAPTSAAAAAAAVVLVAAGASAAAAQDGEPALSVSADAVHIEFTGRVQTQAATSSCSEFPFDDDSPCVDQAPGLDVFLRRVRLAAELVLLEVERDGESVPFLSAKVEPDFGEVDGVELRHAFGRLDFGEHVAVQVGQFKRPFDGFNLVSSSKLLTIERDLDVPGVPGLRAASLDEFATRFNLGSYDIGAMVSGAVAGGRLAYSAGVFNGEPSATNNDRNAEKQFVGRLRYDTEAAGLPLSVAAAGAATDLPFRDTGDQEGRPRSGAHYHDWEVFAELGGDAPGPQVQAGLLFGDNPLEDELGRPPEPAAEGGADFATMTAWQAVGAYRFTVPGTPYLEAVEPAFRVTRAEPNTDVDGDETWGFTPGVNVYFHRRNKLQLNLDVVSFTGDRFDTVSSFKTQFQVYF